MDPEQHSKRERGDSYKEAESGNRRHTPRPVLTHDSRLHRHVGTGLICPFTNTLRLRKRGASIAKHPLIRAESRENLAYDHRLSVLDGDRVRRLAVGGHFTLSLSEVNLARTRDLLFGVGHQFVPLRQPP